MAAPAPTLSLSDVTRARERIRDAIYLSPCSRSETLSRRTGSELFVKLDNLQMTGSFKERGARNRLLCLDDAQKKAGVVTASAGNHAQGVAFHAQLLGLGATIVMPVGTPLIKVSATRSYGAEVVPEGHNYEESFARAQQITAERGAAFVPAFDDDLVIAGQGTVGLEILEQVPDVDAIVVPVGGGGLAAGICVAVKETKPDVAVYGVEAAAIPAASRALALGRAQAVTGAATIADGIAVRCIAERTLRILSRHLDGMRTVDEEEIAEAILMLLEAEKTVAEGAGATPLAAVLQHKLPLAGKRVVIVVSGGNIDVNIISRVIDRGLVKSGRLMRLRVHIRDTPGSLADLLITLASTSANVLEIHHDRLAAPTVVGLTAVELVLEVRGYDHIDEIERVIEARGIVRT